MNLVAATPFVVSSAYGAQASSAHAVVPYARLTLPQDQFGANKKEVDKDNEVIQELDLEEVVEKKHKLPRRVQTNLRMEKVNEYLDELREYPPESKERMVGIFKTLTGRFPALHIVQAIGHSRKNPLNRNPDPYISDFVDFAVQAFKDRKSSDPVVAYNACQRLNEYNAAQIKLFREMKEDDLVEAFFKYDQKKTAPFLKAPQGYTG